MKMLSGLVMADGQPVYTQEYAQALRDQEDSLNIVAQLGGQEDMLSSPADIMIGGGSRGGPLMVDTRVVTPFGYRRIGDLKAGDIISGTDGGMQKVVYRKDHGKLPAYKLTFIDGSSVIASYDHLWNVRKSCYISKKRNIHHLSKEDDWRIWTTQMIVDRLKAEKGDAVRNGHIYIPVCEPIHFTRSFAGWYKPKTSPYIIGLILGDGCVTDAATRIYACHYTSADKELLGAFFEAGYKMRKSTSNEYDYFVTSDELEADLKGLKLTGCDSSTKFVPNIFKYGTVETRWSVLQGLMDTDGTIDKRGHCAFSTVSRRLAEDVKFLVNSLGGLATITKCQGAYVKDGIKIECQDYYQIYIKIKDSFRLFRLQRKRERSTKFNGGISEYMRRIVDFEYVGEQECCCIAVNNTNSLFMVEDFIVTHNSKSFSLLLEALKDADKRHFRSIILRNEKPDLDDIVETSGEIFSQYGVYNKSQNDMTWNFYAGGKLRFSYYEGDFEKFKKRFQGKQSAFIGIDEITHCPYNKFKYLMTINRNAHHLRSRFWGTCNPDPDSWVAKFIEWWIDEDGYPIPERNGVLRYCYMPSDDVNEIYWGDTREEVWEQCKDEILRHWKPKFSKYGTPAELSIKSVAFVEAKLEDNKKLMASDPGYIANLMNQNEEQQSRDLDGNWKFRSAGDDMIKMDDMLAFYGNAQQLGDSRLYATADVALQGGDNFVMWLWQGWHIKDVFVCRFDAKALLNVVREKLTEWGVQESDFTYDMQGLGQILTGFFPDAVPFNNQASPIAMSKAEEAGIKNLYKDLKSQCAYLMYKKIRDLEISIDDRLLHTTFDGHGYGKTPLGQILMKERKCIRRTAASDGKAFQLIPKCDMKKIIGHSPDFFESIIFRIIFTLKHKKHVKAKGTWCI